MGFVLPKRYQNEQKLSQQQQVCSSNTYVNPVKQTTNPVRTSKLAKILEIKNNFPSKQNLQTKIQEIHQEY